MKVFTAAFDIEYAGAYVDIVASCPAPDETLTMRPYLARAIAGRKRAADFNHAEQIRFEGPPIVVDGNREYDVVLAEQHRRVVDQDPV